MANPKSDDAKVFISYSWSSPDHKTWVLALATRLTEDGHHTILDEWDLQVGHDPIAFMEQSITSPQVSKVLIICDRVYKEKADSRSGGVGAETQILTPEIYRKTDQNKYAAIVTEVDEDGNAFIPTFYGGRIFIDYSDRQKEEEAYEQLVRWINNAPLHVRPKLGQKPQFLKGEVDQPLATASRFKRAKDALEKGSSGATGFIRDFGEGLTEQVRLLRSDQSDLTNGGAVTDDLIIAASERMRPYIRQFFEIGRAVARFRKDAWGELIPILEGILAETERSPQVNRWNAWDFDSNKMMAYEAFLGLAGVMIAENSIDLLSEILGTPFYHRNLVGGRGRSSVDYGEFNQYVESLRHRKDRLQLNTADLQADIISEAYSSGFPPLARLVEADLLLYLRPFIIDPNAHHIWFPHTLIYAGRHTVALELFARMESRRSFERVSGHLFGGASPDTYRERVSQVAGERLWSNLMWGPSIHQLANVEHVAVRP